MGTVLAKNDAVLRGYRYINKTTQTYENLNQEQRQILNKRYLEGEHTSSEWINLLKGLVDYDKCADKARVFKIGNPMFTIQVLLLMSLTIIALASFSMKNPLIMVIGIPITLGAIMAYHYSPAGKKRHEKEQKQQDMANKFYKIMDEFEELPNHLRLFVMPLITFLSERIDATEKIQLKVNLDIKKQDHHRLELEDEIDKNYYTKTGFNYEGTEFYRYDLMSLSSKLKDGTIIDFYIVDMIRNRRFVAQNTEGDDTHKWRSQMTISYFLKLQVPKINYERRKNAENIQEKETKLTYIEKDHYHVFNLKANSIKKLQRYYYFDDFDIDQEIYYIPDVDFVSSLIDIIYMQQITKRNNN